MQVYKAEDYIKPGLHLHISFSTCKQPENLHCHDFPEIVYIVSGSALQTVDGRTYRAEQGDLLFINRKSTHAIAPNGRAFSYYNLILNPDIFSENIVTEQNAFGLLSLTAFDQLRDGADSGDRLITFGGEDRLEFERILNAMLREYEREQMAYASVLNSYLNVLFTLMLRRFLWNTDDTARPQPERWKQLLQYIDENLDRKLTLGELAKACFYNPSYFSRVFKEKYHLTLVEYLNRERAARAATLLKTTDLTVLEICERCGYGDKSGLYRGFQRIYGCTPSEYRKK